MRCDSHVHIVASSEEHPQISGRTFLAGPAPLSSLVAHGRPHGIDHFVITQPSFYGTDNTVLLNALDDLDGYGRGVVVVEPSIDAQALRAMKLRDVSGLRVNLYSPAAENVGSGTADLRAIAILAERHGLHVEIIASLELLLANAELIGGSGVPTVIDHYGLYGRSRPSDDKGRALLRLLEAEHLWVKLSSPYRALERPLNI